MRGEIRLKKGRPRYFELRVYAGKDAITGRYKKVSRGFNGAGYKTDAAALKAAETKLAALITEVAAERHKASEGTMAYVLRQWIKDAPLDLEETTAKGYNTIVEQLVESDLGAVRLCDLTIDTLATFFKNLQRCRAAQTVSNYKTVVRLALDLAVQKKWIATNLARELPRSRRQQATRAPVKAPSAEDVRRLIDKAGSSNNPDLGALFRVAAATGARRGEVCALQWKHFDPKTGTLLIEQSAAHGKNGVKVKGTKTHAARAVALGRGTVAALVGHRKNMEIRNGGPLPDDAYIFSTGIHSERAMRPDGVTQAFRRLCKDLGIKGERLHGLRHHFATSQLSGGTDVGTVADMLGHQDASMTLDVYRHFVPAAGKKAAVKIDKLLDA